MNISVGCSAQQAGLNGLLQDRWRPFSPKDRCLQKCKTQKTMLLKFFYKKQHNFASEKKHFFPRLCLLKAFCRRAMSVCRQQQRWRREG
jgi:hypothetical protein